MDKIEKLIRERNQVERQYNETTKRMDAKKNMNGYHWDDRASAVEVMKNISKKIDEEVKGRLNRQ